MPIDLEVPHRITPYGRRERLLAILEDLESGDPLVTLSASAMLVAEVRALVRELEAQEVQ